MVGRWKDKDKKRVEEPEPPAEKPPVESTDSSNFDAFGIKKIYASAPNGDSWKSNWDDASRSVGTECHVDPKDSRVKFTGTNATIGIADGILKTGITRGDIDASPRARVKGVWKNVESTLYIRVPSVAATSYNADIRPRTDHYCMIPDTNDGFGGYICNIDFATQRINLRREHTHNIGYSDRRATKSITLKANTWYGFKAICYNLSDKTVKLELWMDTTDGAGGGIWTKECEDIDNANWGGPGGNQPPNLGPNEGSGIRSNIDLQDGYIEYKKWTIREIKTI